MEHINLLVIKGGRKMKNKITIIALCFVLLVGIVGCSTASEKTTSENITENTSEKVTLRLSGGDTGLPTPFKHTSGGPGASKVWLLYDSLLEKDENSDIPWLAKSWEVSEDGTVYTFHMQENALWHDEEPLTAEDVAFTIDYYKKYPPVSNDLVDNGQSIVADCKVIDTYTVQITTNGFKNTYLSKLGSFSIIPKHIWENVEEPATFESEEATVGSGPYKMESYNPEQGTYRYVAFDKYWGLEPAVAAIEWVPVSDSILAFENNEIDLCSVPSDVLSRYTDNDEYKVEMIPAYRNSYRLIMNIQDVDELKDVNLRKALAYAINRQELVDKVGRSAGIVNSMGYVPSASPWYNTDIEKYEFDLEKAKELLEGEKYSFTLLTDNSSSSIKIAELMRLTLAEAGIQITVESVESKTRDSAIESGQYQLALTHAGGMGGDPDYLRSIYAKTNTNDNSNSATETASSSTGQGKGQGKGKGNGQGQGSGQGQGNGNSNNSIMIRGWSNDRVNELANMQATECNQEKRKEMIFEMQEIIADEVPMIMLYSTTTNFVYRPAKYDGWMMIRYDNNARCDFYKLSYVVRK